MESTFNITIESFTGIEYCFQYMGIWGYLVKVLLFNDPHSFHLFRMIFFAFALWQLICFIVDYLNSFVSKMMRIWYSMTAGSMNTDNQGDGENQGPIGAGSEVTTLLDSENTQNGTPESESNQNVAAPLDDTD